MHRDVAALIGLCLGAFGFWALFRVLSAPLPPPESRTMPYPPETRICPICVHLYERPQVLHDLLCPVCNSDGCADVETELLSELLPRCDAAKLEDGSVQVLTEEDLTPAYRKGLSDRIAALAKLKREYDAQKQGG